MPPSNVLHLPARHVPRPGATRPACSSREAGRTSSPQAVAQDGDYVFLCSETGGDVILRLMRQRPETFDEWANRQDDDDEKGAMAVVAYVFAAFLVAVVIGTVIVLVPAFQIMFGQGH